MRVSPIPPSDLPTGSLPSRIEKRLKQLGKTTRGAAIEAGLSASSIRNILEGKSTSPRMDTVEAIAKVLQVDVGWFVLTEASND